MSSNPYNYMDYGGRDHQTADHGCVWLFGYRSKSVGASLCCDAYRLYARSVCDTKALLQLRCAACGAIYLLYAFA